MRDPARSLPLRVALETGWARARAIEGPRLDAPDVPNEQRVRVFRARLDAFREGFGGFRHAAPAPFSGESQAEKDAEK